MCSRHSSSSSTGNSAVLTLSFAQRLCAMAASSITPPTTELAKAILEIVARNPSQFEGLAGVPVPGSHALFDRDAFLLEMAEHKAGVEYNGRAHALFALCCESDAMRNVPVSIHDVGRYRDERFSKLSSTDVPKWRFSVTVAVTADTLDAIEKMEDPGAPVINLFRKISMDIMIYAFLLEFWSRLVAGEPHESWPTNFWDAARHVPINFVFFEPSADLEQNIYVHAMQIMEDFRSNEEAHAAGAWQLCQMWAEARRLQTDVTANAEEAVDGAVTLLARINYIQPAQRLRGQGDALD